MPSKKCPLSFQTKGTRVLPTPGGRTHHLPAAPGTHEKKNYFFIFLKNDLMHLIHLKMQ
jgi:hypothetical protein